MSSGAGRSWRLARMPVTVARPDSLHSAPDLVAQTGGLSGAPLMGPSTRVLEQMYILTNGGACTHARAGAAQSPPPGG